MDAGLMTGMENYISVNGVPVIENTKLMTKLLRDDLGFDGMMVSDFSEINALHTFHRTARSEAEGTKFSLERTSIDMSMVGLDLSFTNATTVLLDKKPEILDRLKESARRVIKVKLKLGLYDDVAASLAGSRESIVLLQNNDSTLPLAKDATAFLTGHSAHNIGCQCGGWTIMGQGISGNNHFSHGVSVKQGFEAVANNGSVTYFNGLNVTGEYTEEDLATAKQYANQAEYTVAVIGEHNYEEKTGDSKFEMSVPSVSCPVGIQE